MSLSILSLALAALLGFSAHRASLCTVRAVAELISTGRAYILSSILKSILWVLAITLPVMWLAPGAGETVTGWALTPLSLAGGFAFGVGSALNGGCAFSTLNQLADGRLRMIGTLGGFVLGVAIVLACARPSDLPLPSSAHIASLAQQPIALAASLALMVWAVHEARRLWIGRRAGVGIFGLLFEERYRLSTAAALMGLSNAALYLMHGSWSYTSTLQHGIENALSAAAAPAAMLWALFTAMFGGMVASTLQRGSFKLSWRPRRDWLRNLAGGTLMGIGAVLVPGGNDALILHDIPALSANAVPAYLAMLAGIAAVLVAMRRLSGVEVRVDCGGDICRAPERS